MAYLDHIGLATLVDNIKALVKGRKVLTYWDAPRIPELTITSSGYVAVPYETLTGMPIQKSQVVMVTVYNWSTATGAFNVQQSWVYGTAGTKITNLGLRLWYYV